MRNRRATNSPDFHREGALVNNLLSTDLSVGARAAIVDEGGVSILPGVLTEKRLLQKPNAVSALLIYCT